MKILAGEGLTFDDVLLVPQKTSLMSRKEADTRTRLTRAIELNIPVISSNMDTVTESAMAIAMASLGGIGIIHRFLTIEDELAQVHKVKRAESVVIEEPYTIGETETIEAAKHIMTKLGVSGLVVVGPKRKLLGILSSRDIQFAQKPEKTLVREAMTPRKKLVTGRPGISADAARKLLQSNRVEKLPLVDADGTLRGLITSKDLIERKTLYPHAAKDKKGHLLVGAAIGVKGDYLDRAKALLEAGTDVLVLDIAHGHATYAIDAIKKIKRNFGKNTQLIAGNTATYQGTKELVEAGADAVKVGVGPGAACITRIVTGSGVPQLTAIMDCARITKETGIPIIADGGIRGSGDMVKAIAAGASTVMVGSMLAGTEESPGHTIVRDGIRYKVYRGMASLGAALGRAQRTRDEMDEDEFERVVPEGVEALVPYRGTCAEVIGQAMGGFRSGMSYCGARTIKEMQAKAVFTKISFAAYLESRPHDLTKA